MKMTNFFLKFLFLFLADDEPPSSARTSHAGDELAQLAPFAPVGLPTAALLDGPRARSGTER